MPKGQVFPEEFRREAIELARTSGKSKVQLAEELGISKSTLTRWCSQAEIDAGKREGLTSEDKGELRVLVHRRAEGQIPSLGHVQGGGGLAPWLSCLETP